MYSDCGRNIDDRKSTSGYVLKLDNNLAAVSWGSKKQTSVAKSTAEAELATSKFIFIHTYPKTIHINRLSEELGVKVDAPIQIQVDNQALIAMCCRISQHQITKRIAIAVNFIKDLTEKKMIKLNYTLTNEMQADLFTKSLVRIKTEKFIHFYNGN